MKIEWNKNPLATKVELDEHEKEVFRLKIKLKEMEEIAYSGYFTLTHHQWWNDSISKNGKEKPARTLEDTVAEAVKELNPDYWLDEEDGKKCKLDERVDSLLQHFLEELQGFHLGDCTCFPMSCSKCHAESTLGIDTTKGLGKHPGYYIEAAFSQWNPETKKHDRPEVSLDQALKKLQAAKDQAAYEWLLNYKNTHFKD